MSDSQQYPFPTSRPRLSLERPHTVHSSTQPSFMDIDHNHNPSQEHLHTTAPAHRPSLCPLGVLLEAADTTLGHSDPSDNTSDLPGFLAESLPPDSRIHRRLRRVPLRGLTHNFAIPTTASSSSTPAAIDDPPQTASLTRRFSKKYKQRMADLKENFAHYTTAPSAVGFGVRNRRMTTPSDSGQHTLITPTSPSKRNGKHSDDRPKKLRPGVTLATDRKDTPAPLSGPACKQPLHVQATMPYPSNTIFNGGDGARQAAARYNACAGFDNDITFTQDIDDLVARRARLGSLSSAADSGADLTLCNERQDTPRLDDDGDLDMEDLVHDQLSSQSLPQNFDPVHVLPDEIALQIFEQLDAPVLASAMQVNAKWNDLANQTSVWRKAFLRRWNRPVYTNPPPILVGGPGIGQPNKPLQAWKDMYRARKELDANWRRGAANAGKATYLSGHTDSVYCVQFDEEKIITGSRDRTIRVWDINTMQCTRVIGGPLSRPTPGPKPLRTVDYPSFHSAVASVNGSVYGNSIYQVPSQWHDASILCLQYDDKILVTGSSDSDLLVWDIQTYQPIKRLKKHTGGVLDVALDAKHIISCSKDSRIVVWDRQTYEVKGVLSGHRGPVNAVQLRGKLLVSASGDGIARLWDIEHMRLLKEFSAKERGLAAVEFSEDMKYVLAGGNDHITYKFEVETGREVAQFVGHTQLVRSLWLDSANNRVVSGSYDLDLRVYDFATGQEIWHADEWTTSWMLAAKSDYRRIVATSQDGRILVIDFGLYKGGKNDGLPIKDVEKLRAIPLENTNAIIFRNPFAGPNESPMIFAR